VQKSDYLPHIAYDSVILGFSGTDLRILIMEYHNTGLFALPGGFVKKDETLDDAVRRGLEERTGIKDIYLEQFHTFGDLARYQPEVMEGILKANNKDTKTFQWLLDRFISVAYYALINYDAVVPRPDALSDSCIWYPIKKLPKLILDHKVIVDKAIETLRDNLDRKSVGGNLLPEKFTMKELQHVHEAILGVKLRRTSFQRKILASDVLKRHEKRFSGKAHKAPYLYSFKKS
jgi:8-oxo-dGTP diphosphatase